MLAIGLCAAGVGTMVFLRNAQLNALDDSLSQLVTNPVALTVFDVSVGDGKAHFDVDGTMAATQFYVAVYGPDGTFLGETGGDRRKVPRFPKTYPLEKTLATGTDAFALHAASGSATFRASVDTLPVPGVQSKLYTQLVALPVAPVNQMVASFIGIYTVLALLIILVGALLTRWLVTLTFRGLGQVENTAMSIASGDFGQRMGDVIPGTEVGRLKTAINAMLDRVDAALSQRDKSVQQMRRFIGDASHELRTPLVTVRGYAELYRMGAISGPEATAQSMERIEKEAIRMGVLVEDLLALARLDERRDIVVTDVDLRPIARDAILDARASAPERPVTAAEPLSAAPAGSTTTRDGDLAISEATPRRGRPAKPPTGNGGTLSRLRRRPRVASAGLAPDSAPAVIAAPAAVTAPIVLGDENRIRQVVANLLGNARRYSPAASPIELAVGVDLPAGMGWIAVIDHGEGIPEQIREKIFQRFWRADTSRTRETGGSGLGLSIVASVVDALHGSITVTETPGGGATFTVGFPLAASRPIGDHLNLETQPLPKLR